MTIKEFSHKHAQVFFWATIVLAILLLITICGRRYDGRHGYMMRGGYERYDNKMMNKDYYKNTQGGNMQNGQQRQMMNPNNPNQPLINDTPNAAGTVETGAAVNPNIPVQTQ